MSLRQGRLLGTANVMVPGTTALFPDVLQGDMPPESLAFVFATVVALLPYRAWHTFSIGTGLTLLVLGAGSGLRPALGLDPAAVQTGTYALHIGLITVLMTGLNGVVHRNRYRRHEAEQAREHAERRAERLAALDASKNRLFANVSHELRTPLTTILGPLADALQGRYGDVPTGLRKRLKAMKGQAERLRALVDQLRRLSELEEGQMELEARPIELHTFLGRMASLFEPKANGNGTEIRVETDGAPIACADPEALKQIVSNLLSNALEHAPTSSTVHVRAAPLPPQDAERVRTGDGEQKGGVVISVRDSGPGLPEAVQGAPFERYTGTRPRADGSGVGTGIGLAVVQELAERHGGWAEAQSETGQGTTITVALPASCTALAEKDRASDNRAAGDAMIKDPPPEAAAVPGPVVEQRPIWGPTGDGSPNARTGKGVPDDPPTVLIVDDEADVRRYLQEVLTPRYAPRPAADGEEALRMAHEERPALVVSDVIMPRRDGYELCRAIRADEQLRDVPVILLTVQDEQERRMEGLREGADAYLTKPFHPDELRQRIENLISVRRYLRSSRPKDSSTRDSGPIPEGPAADVGTESELLQTARAAIEEHLSSSSFGVEWLADEVGLSTRQLQRRLQKETGLTAAAFIRAIRLERAAEFLKAGDVPTVKAAAEAVGYRNASYFSRLFKEAHGAPPSELKSEG